MATFLLLSMIEQHSNNNYNHLELKKYINIILHFFAAPLLKINLYFGTWITVSGAANCLNYLFEIITNKKGQNNKVIVLSIYDKIQEKINKDSVRWKRYAY